MKYCAAIDLGASSGRIAIGAIDQGKLTITEVHRFKHEAKEFEDRGLRWEWAKIVEEVKTGSPKRKNTVRLSPSVLIRGALIMD